MPFHRHKSRQFKVGLPDAPLSEWSRLLPDRGLHLASESVLRLAKQIHQAVARGDTSGAEAARVSLEKQLALATGLINELLFNGTEQPTAH